MNYKAILEHFKTQGTISEVKPLGDGLINQTLIVKTQEADAPDYVLQRVNDAIFQDVDLLQKNIEYVTDHIRQKLAAKGETDLERKTLTLIGTDEGKTYYYCDEEGIQGYWRLTIFIPRSVTKSAVTPESSRLCGQAFGDFQAMLADIDKPIGESIPDFHNMELRLRQLREAVKADAVGRVKEVQDLIDEIEKRSVEMTQAEELFRQGKLPKRICHCDTKVNNMLFDADDDSFLCVIDLDTIMPSFIFSDYGDFLRTAANTVAEDDPNYDKVAFRKDIYEAFTEGYLSTAKFLTDIEIKMLPYAVKLFPYMQASRFLADYINGDTYYSIKYPEHNLVRTKNQIVLLKAVEAAL